MVKKPRIAAILAFVATAWLALAVIFAGVFIVVEHNHEHINTASHPVPSGKDCQVCLEIQIAQRIIEAFGRLGAIIAVSGFIFFAFSFAKPRRVFYSLNPVGLKIKSNC